MASVSSQSIDRMDTPLYPATEGVVASLEEAVICRICLSSDEQEKMIAPCSCRGSARWVHRDCLDEWRAQERVPWAFTHCSVCRDAYEFEAASTANASQQQLRFGLLVTRDIALFFLLLQSTIAGLGFLMHAIDRGVNCPDTPSWAIPCNTTITKLYPRGWADSNSISHLRLGPYYVTAVVLLLALLGVLGLVLALAGHLPRAPTTRASAFGSSVAAPISSSHAAPDIRRRQRVTTARACDCRDCGNCGPCYVCDDCDCLFWPCYVSDGPGSCCDGCCAVGRGCARCDGCRGGGGSCCECGECGAGDSSDAGAFALVVVAAVVVVFVLIGIFVGVFLCTLLFQRIVQSHVHLLRMRSEARRLVVKDLASESEHLELQSGGGGRGGSTA